MNTFKTELFEVSFHAENPKFPNLMACTITKRTDESYSTFTNLPFLCSYVCELNQSYQLDKKEASKILSKASLFLLD